MLNDWWKSEIWIWNSAWRPQSKIILTILVNNNLPRRSDSTKTRLQALKSLVREHSMHTQSALKEQSEITQRSLRAYKEITQRSLQSVPSSVGRHFIVIVIPGHWFCFHCYCYARTLFLFVIVMLAIVFVSYCYARWEPEDHPLILPSRRWVEMVVIPRPP